MSNQNSETKIHNKGCLALFLIFWFIGGIFTLGAIFSPSKTDKTNTTTAKINIQSAEKETIPNESETEAAEIKESTEPTVDQEEELERKEEAIAPTTQETPKEEVKSTTTTNCDCSKTCTQIATCDEAYYQLNTCGCSARDTDDDGVPCESLCKSNTTAVVAEEPIPVITPEPTPAPIPTPTPEPEPTSPYTCNCSRTCTQITTCEEAYYQLNTCGCNVRDRDNDGIPCEDICN